MNTASPISIRNQYCPNNSHDHPEQKILIHSQKEKRLKCANCDKTWTISYGTPWFGLKLAKEKYDRAKILRSAGWSVRRIANVLDLNPSTIQRWKKR